MVKNDAKANKRIEILVKAFVESEYERYQNNKNMGAIKKYFRFTHLGNRLHRKINASKNELYILRSADHDVEIRIKKGDGSTIPKIVEIKNNELCWLNV